jgi:hypothetical protein
LANMWRQMAKARSHLMGLHRRPTTDTHRSVLTTGRFRLRLVLDQPQLVCRKGIARTIDRPMH